MQPNSDSISSQDAVRLAKDVLGPETFFDDRELETATSSRIGDPQQRARKVFHNAQKLANRERDRRDRKYRHRRPRKDDVSINMGDNAETDQHRERLDKRLDRYQQERQRASRDAIRSRETTQRHFQEQYGHLASDSRSGVRHRFGGSDERSARKSSSTDRHRRNQGRGHEDPNERAMRRLRRLAAY